MQNLERHEKRYFFSSIRLPEILTVLRSVVDKEIVNECPVTETIYFNLEHGIHSVLPRGLRVRARRYIKKTTSMITIDDSSFFLEIKKEGADGMNHKQRILSSGLQIVETLSKPNAIYGLPKLVACVATQSLRYHWSLGEFGRLTLDEDVKLFGFGEYRPLEAEYICNLGEGKLEFKLENKSIFPTQTQIIEETRCVEHDALYLERKVVQCMKIWSNQKPN